MSSRHPRAATLTASGLFRGISSFHDLEARITLLPEELARGDAFEVFVEAYLWTTAVWQVADLWLVGRVPLDIRRTLNLPADAKGIDGVFRTRSGSLVPYQVKFRIDRPVVGVTEVATFLGLTERATDRVLITNAHRVNPDVEVRDHLRLLRGTDFDALTADDWTAITDWLEARPVTRPKATPRDDQQRALTAIANALDTHDRATVVMPCGTGKTLVQLWSAEQQKPKTVLVLVPSLALLSQTLDQWSRHTSWGNGFEYLCVCSDPSVSAEQDAVQIRSTDVPFHVDTDPAVVRRFLDRPSTASVRVVFSTYQSAPVVADGMRGLAPFALGIFDEAHKTTGLRGGVFAFALDDARLPIRKRVFFTATPRHIDIRHRDREGDFPVVSMDDPEVYGPRTHTQTFAEAVALGIICDYRVVVSVVDPDEVTAFALQHGITLVKGDQQATQWVATQIAVSKAIAETGASKVITFHSRVKQAQDFASATPRGIGQYLDGFVVDHVNGAQRVADRKAILSGFADSQRRLVTNARCLTEGVDLPAVDMVAFSNPRKSRVDIVQAVGRAMRKPQGGTKTLGYVVLPILLAPHQTNDITEACSDTDWADVIDVLAALREQDARLDEIIRAQQIARGRDGAFNPRAFAERVQVLGPLVSLELLDRHVGAVMLDSLGVSWDEHYGQLVAFKDIHGHSDVPHGYPENPKLGKWLSTQRQARQRAALSADRVARLDALGVTWEVREAWWEEQYQTLVAFKQKHGHCNVSKEDPDTSELGSWVQAQRSRMTQLSEQRITRLDELGFVWAPHDAAWEKQYQALAAFRDRHRHSNVPSSYPENRVLSDWLRFQRQLRRRGTLSADRVARLDALGVTWDPRDALWEERYQELIALKEKYGNCNVPRHFTELERWLGKQRRVHKRGALSAERVARLEALVGVVWERRDGQWEKRYRELIAFKQKQGHTDVPLDYPEKPKLGRWVSNQRSRGTLSADRVARLETLGFVWNTNDARWEAQYQALVAFKEQHGHCNVPADYPENHSLGRWVIRQRHARQTGELWLSSERMARLDALGFKWNAFEDRWEAQCQALVEFKERHGHCNVQVLDPNNPALGKWLHKQRQKRQRGALSAGHVARLDALGVVWDFRDSWEERYSQLVAFKKKYGHCHVQTVDPESRPLGIWLTWQRRAKRQETLSADRLARLTALGVVWDGIDAQWEIQYQALVAFKAEHGHCNVPFNYPEDISPPSGRRYRPRGTALGSWLRRQRTELGRGGLSTDRIARLNALGLVWDPIKRKK